MASRTRVPRLADPDIVIRKADSKEEIDAANWLVFSNYVAEGYWDNDTKHVFENQWLQSPCRHVFVALRDGEIVGTVSIICDSDAGLPSDGFQPKWLEHFRRSGDRLAEGSALAVAKDRPRLRNLSLYLLACYVQYSFYYAKVDRLVQACRCSHADFYADVLRFEKIGGIVYNSYARWPGQLLSLDLIDAHRILSDYYEPNGMTERNFYRFLMIEENPNIQFPSTSAMCRSRQRDWLAYARSRQIRHSSRLGSELERERLLENTAVTA